MKFKFGTFNAENLFLRFKFNEAVDLQKFTDEAGHITDAGIRTTFDKISEPQRKNTAQVIKANKPDVICLQEVENIDTLKKFNSTFLKSDGNPEGYKYAMLVDGNDPRGIDVGILSKFEVNAVWTHQYDQDDRGRIFSRDCLEANVINDNGENMITLFINHLKSKAMGAPAETGERRQRQANRVAQILEERYGNDAGKRNFAVVGDFNDTPDSQYLKPLLNNHSAFENVVDRLPGEEQWTYIYKNKQFDQIDYILLSSALAEKNNSVKPYIERRGLSKTISAYTGPRFPGVEGDGTEASDHCAIFMEVEI